MFKLVLIDDDAEVLAINQKYLTGAGFTVYTAISPREGVLSIRKNLPDCILLDVMLPEADGYRVCRYIRSFSSVPLLFLTARSSEEDVIRGLTCGGDDYLVKPYSLRELKARVDKHNRCLRSRGFSANYTMAHAILFALEMYFRSLERKESPEAATSRGLK